LKDLPGAALAALPLRALDVSHNDLHTMPDDLPETLAMLKCGHNKNLFALSANVGLCARLAEIETPRCKLVTLPPSLRRCVALKKLDVSHNCLEDIPDELASGLTNVTEVVVRGNNLKRFPAGFALGAGKTLRVLDARENAIASVPDAIGACVALQELFLGSNRLAGVLPDSIGEGCVSLVTLDVSRNRLTRLPKSLANLKGTLAAVTCGENDVDAVAPELGTCVNLRVLDLTGNPLRSIRQSVLRGPVRDLLKLLRSRLPEGEAGDEERGAFGAGGDADDRMKDAGRAVTAAVNRAKVAISPVSSAKRNQNQNEIENQNQNASSCVISLRGRGLEEVPAEVWSRETAAATVDLGENALTFVDPEIVRECVTLRALFLDGNALERWPLPVAPGNALPLRQLRLDGNVALRFPTAPGEAFSLCSRLTSLDLSRVAGGDALPGLLAPMKDTLEHLRWERGGLRSIPAEVCGMRSLKTLRLAENAIQEVSPAMRELQNLDEMDLTNNDVGRLPPELGFLNLRWLGLEGNPLRSIRRAIIDKGTPAVLAYLRDKMPQS
jgi:Leucine-rich repeat (LRR) protein